jgi:hypothetical protein
MVDEGAGPMDTFIRPALELGGDDVLVVHASRVVGGQPEATGD